MKNELILPLKIVPFNDHLLPIFYVYALFNHQSCERVVQVMESYSRNPVICVQLKGLYIKSTHPITPFINYITEYYLVAIPKVSANHCTAISYKNLLEISIVN